MEKISFSIKEALRFGWKKTNEHLGVFAFAVLILIGTNIATQSISKTFEDTPYIFIFVFIITFLVSMYVQIGITKLFLRTTSSERPRIKDIYYPLDFKTYKDYILAMIVFMGVSAGPCIILGSLGSFLKFENFSNGISIAWGILFFLSFLWCILSSFRLQFFPYIILDKKTDGIAALRKSMRITSGHMKKLAGLFFLSILIVLGGLIFVFVGLFIAIPVVMLAFISVYKQLLGESYAEYKK